MRIVRRIFNYVYGLYLQYLLWYDRWLEFETPRFVNPVTPQVLREANQLKYEEGILAVKKKVKSLMLAQSSEEYEKVLNSLEDIVSLAEGESESSKKMAEALRSVYVRSGQDVVTHLDKAKMIDERIGHYKELQQYKEKRALLKSMRKAEQNKDTETLKKLKKEWDTKYAKKNYR